jgi:hypothetical protein
MLKLPLAIDQKILIVCHYGFKCSLNCQEAAEDNCGCGRYDIKFMVPYELKHSMCDEKSYHRIITATIVSIKDLIIKFPNPEFNREKAIADFESYNNATQFSWKMDLDEWMDRQEFFTEYGLDKKSNYLFNVEDLAAVKQFYVSESIKNIAIYQDFLTKEYMAIEELVNQIKSE